MTDVTTQTLFDSSVDNTAQALRTSGGYLDFFEVVNASVTQGFLQLFDVASGSVSVGTTTPKLVFFIPPGNGTVSGQRSEVFQTPVFFAVAITYAITTTAAGGTGLATAPAASFGHH